MSENRNHVTIEEAIFLNNGAAIVVMDTSGLVIRANTAAGQMLGYTANELVDSFFIGYICLEGMNNALEKATAKHNSMAKGSDFSSLMQNYLNIEPDGKSVTLIRKDKSHFPGSLCLTPTTNKTGQINGYVGIINNRTVQKKREEEKVFLDSLVSNSTESILSIDSLGIIKRFNSAAELSFGYSAEEVIGKRLITLIPKSINQANVAEMISSLTSPTHKKAGDKFEGIARKKNGQLFPIEIALTSSKIVNAISNETDDKNWLLGVVKDMTESNKKKKEKAFLESIINESMECIISVDSNGVIKYLNGASELTFGYKSIDIVEKNITHLLKETPDKQETKNSFNSLVAMNTQKVGTRREAFGRKKNGDCFPIEFSITAIKIGNEQSYTAIINDITFRKKAEKDILEAKEKIQTLLNNVQRDVDAAGKLQMSLLPAIDTAFNSLNADWLFLPCDSVGGDSLSIFQLDQKRIGFFLLDVVGHGVRSALLSVSIHRLITSCDTKNQFLWNNDASLKSPSETASAVSEEFMGLSDEMMFFTMIVGYFDTEKKEINYVRAGHTPPLHLKQDGCLEELTDGDSFMGAIPGTKFHDIKVTLKPGEMFLIYSDGIVEGRNATKEFWGEKALGNSLQQNKDKSFKEILGNVFNDFQQHMGDEKPQDDIALLLLQAK